MRTYLTADTTYNVPGDFPDLMTAYQSIRDTVDFGGKKVTVQVENGDHGPVLLEGAMTGQAAEADFCIRGDVSNPALCSFSGVGANAITVRGGARLKIEGLMAVAVQSQSFMGGGHGLVVYEGSRVVLGNMAWHVCDYSHIDVASDGHIRAEFSVQSLVGTSRCFVLAEDYSKVWLNGVQVINTVSQWFADGFIQTSRQSMVDCSGTILIPNAPLSGKVCDAKEGSLVILLGMNRQGMSDPVNDGTSMVTP